MKYELQKMIQNAKKRCLCFSSDDGDANDNGRDDGWSDYQLKVRVKVA